MISETLSASDMSGDIASERDGARLCLRRLPGTPFYGIFKRYDNDFYKIDPLLFSPAEVWLTSVSSGRTFHAGRVNAAVLRASFA